MNKTKVLYISFLCCFICFFSCKKTATLNTNEHRVWLNPDIELEKGFTVVLDMTVEYDDIFKIYYCEDASEAFNEKRTVTSNILGSNNNQIITFSFPKRVEPKRLRIDFGVNKNQKTFKLNILEIKDHKNNIKILPDTLIDYFDIFNKNLLYDSVSNTLSVVKKPNDKYLPSIVSKELLTTKLTKWYIEKEE